MEIWLDTTEVRPIQTAARFGLLSGVTTNPTLIAGSKRDLEEVIEDLLHYQEGPVAVQVTGKTTVDMVQQGQTLHGQSNRLIIKVPVTKEGLEAIHLLSRQGILTMATAVFHTRQALLAALAGANYVAPYLGRLEKEGGDPWNLLREIAHLFQTYRLKTNILAASLPSVEHVIKCGEIGIFGVTVKEDLFEKLIQSDPLTVREVEQFALHSKAANALQH